MMNKIILPDGFLLEYELERKRVKNINLRIRPDGSVHVSAPKALPLRYVEDFLRRCAPRIRAAVERAERLPPHEYRPGAFVPVLGESRLLSVCRGGKNAVSLEEGGISVSLKDENDRELLKKTLDSFFSKLCRERMEDICRGLHPRFLRYVPTFPELRIRRMKSRWGSCMPVKGAVTFNSLLAMSPERCMEYVAAHEFCHFIHPDHSPAFYAALESFVPDWRARKKELENYSPWLN